MWAGRNTQIPECGQAEIRKNRNTRNKKNTGSVDNKFPNFFPGRKEMYLWYFSTIYHILKPSFVDFR
jgi:hypothetical protein